MFETMNQRAEQVREYYNELLDEIRAWDALEGTTAKQYRSRLIAAIDRVSLMGLHYVSRGDKVFLSFCPPNPGIVSDADWSRLFTSGHILSKSHSAVAELELRLFEREIENVLGDEARFKRQLKFWAEVMTAFQFSDSRAAELLQQ